jgi:DNA-binding NarL/FixJ family response regulator
VKILYVENHAIFAKQVCQQFLSDHHVEVVSSLSVARQRLAEEKYELLIADYDLDDGKGDEIVRMCRTLKPQMKMKPQMKIIAASSHDAGNTALMKAGAFAVCGKMEFDKIAQVIKCLENEPAD